MSRNSSYPQHQIFNKKILYCVLNWGLGHATRSAALIEQLLLQGNEITIASDNDALIYLQKRFPQLPIINLPSYNIKYPNKIPLSIALLMQVPHFFKTIKEEKKVIDEIESSFDLILSDNRYGCYSKSKTSIVIAHQLNLQVSIPFLSGFVNHQQNKMFRNFSAIWVPDNDHNLTGVLTNTELEIPVHQIGLLSLFKPMKSIDKDIYLLIIISGPEPARSDFEKRAIRYCRYNDYPAIIVGGKLKDQVERKHTNIDYRAYCPAEELNELVSRSRKIICRAGYSTLMDIFQSEYKGELLLIPTPGQTEQEYLAKYLAAKHGFIHTISQSDFFSS